MIKCYIRHIYGEKQLALNIKYLFVTLYPNNYLTLHPISMTLLYEKVNKRICGFCLSLDVVRRFQDDKFVC